MQRQRFVPSIAPKVIHILLLHFVAGLGHDARSQRSGPCPRKRRKLPTVISAYPAVGEAPHPCCELYLILAYWTVCVEFILTIARLVVMS